MLGDGGSGSVSHGSGPRPARVRRGWLAPTAAGVVVLLALVCAAAPAHASAGGGPQLEVAGGPPGHLVVEPGGSAATSFVVTNPAFEPETVEVLVSGLATEGSGVQFEGSPSPGLAVAASPSVFHLGPRGSETVGVSLRVARGVAPGGRYAGLIFRVVPPSVSGRVVVVAEVGRPLLVRIPGPAADTGAIAGFSVLGRVRQGGPATALLRFTNTGTIDYPVSGTVAFSSAGRTLATIALEPATVLPSDTRSFLVTWKGPVPAGGLEALATVHFGVASEHTAQANTTAAVLPAARAATAPRSGPAHLRRAPLPAPQLAPRVHGVGWTWEASALGLLLAALLVLALEEARRRARRRATLAR